MNDTKSLREAITRINEAVRRSRRRGSRKYTTKDLVRLLYDLSDTLKREKPVKDRIVISFEVVGPYEVVENWLDTAIGYIRQFISSVVWGSVESVGSKQRVYIEIPKRLTDAEILTLRLLIESLGRALLNSYRLSVLVSKKQKGGGSVFLFGRESGIEKRLEAVETELAKIKAELIASHITSPADTIHMLEAEVARMWSVIRDIWDEIEELKERIEELEEKMEEVKEGEESDR